MIVRPLVCRSFIGRDRENAYLHECRREADASRGGLVLVGGEAGVGKTRLLSELRLALAKSRTRVAIGDCIEFAQRPYAPILQLLRRFNRAEPGAVTPLTTCAEFEAMLDGFDRAAARTTLVAVIEDVHLADSGTLEFLEYLAPRLQSMRILVIASYRPDARPDVGRFSHAGPAGRIDLEPFGDLEAKAFVRCALGEVSLPADTIAAILRSADGNPFFILELLKSAVERGAKGAPIFNPRALPATVVGAIRDRVRPLHEDERRILAHAAVIGPVFGIGLLAAVLDVTPESLAPALRRAGEYRAIAQESDGDFRFRHPLTREMMYGDFLQSEICALHRKIAEALESAPEAALESLAYHWWAAREPRKALSYNELAGDAAAEALAHEDAILAYERAIEGNSDGGTDEARVRNKIIQTRLAIERGAAIAAAPGAETAYSGGRLSSRETEVASLVALGHSNLEIARALVISLKTVEKHLGSIYRKLGIASRTRLIRRMSAHENAILGEP